MATKNECLQKIGKLRGQIEEHQGRRKKLKEQAEKLNFDLENMRKDETLSKEQKLKSSIQKLQSDYDQKI